MTQRIYTERPPTARPTARLAWDEFSRKREAPVQMWHTHLTYGVWVAEFADGDTDEIEDMVISFQVKKRRNERHA